MVLKTKKLEEALANSKKTAALNWESLKIEDDITVILLEQFGGRIFLEEARKAAKKLIALHEKALLKG
jgi:hypothetical protein